MHLLVSNILGVSLLILAFAFHDSKGICILPLSSIRILWVNIVTCSALAFGLSMEEAPTHDTRVGIFTREFIINDMIGSVGILVVIYRPGGSNLGNNYNGYRNESYAVVLCSA
jgi:magnesium-transporting ATPase (P-type)